MRMVAAIRRCSAPRSSPRCWHSRATAARGSCSPRSVQWWSRSAYRAGDRPTWTPGRRWRRWREATAGAADPSLRVEARPLSFDWSQPRMMHPRLAELSEYLAHQRRTLLDVASAVPADSWQTRPSDGETWSVSEVLEHLYRVERGAAAVLTKRIAKAREAGHVAETETSSVLGTLDQFGVSELGRRLVAPELVRPI